MQPGMQRSIVAAFVALMIPAGGCLPTTGLPALEFIAGGTGDPAVIGDAASVTVLSPVSDLSIAGGTPIEVNWRAVATSRTAVVDVFFDADLSPDNGNEVIISSNLPITDATSVLDTTRLNAGDFFVGVRVEQTGVIVAFNYAPGRITVNQRPLLFFTSPRDNFTFDRTEQANPRFDVAWELDDPDSIVSVQIFLDPDQSPNGNEILLRESNSQSGDSFTFDLPTAAFDAGTYRLLALVTDGVDSFATYAPGSIRLRSRLAGVIDLRDIALPTSGLEGAVFEGFNPRDNCGSFLARATDIDGDGFGDIIMLSQFGKPQFQLNVSQNTGVGEAYLVYGRPERFSGAISVNSVGTLLRGDIYGGVPELPDPIRPSRGITSCAILTDWDGDGVREIAFGLPFVDSLPVGNLGVGTDAGTIAPLDPAGYFRSGVCVIAAGSSLRPDLGFPGRHVFNLAEFGTIAHEGLTPCACPEGFVTPKSPTSADSSTCFHRHRVDEPPGAGGLVMGCRISSNEFGDQFGETVAAGEFSSIIMSAPNRDPLVATFRNSQVGGSIPGGGTISIFYRIGGAPWSGVNTPAANDQFGYPGTLEPGPEDLLPHGGPYHYIVDEFRVFAQAQVPFTGSPGYTVDPQDGAPCVRDFWENTPRPARTTRLWSSTVGARLSNAASVADFNADGLQDILIGAPFAEAGSGACFLVLGRLRDLVMAGELEVEQLARPLNSPEANGGRVFDGIRIVGAPGDRLGQTQDSAGDFNGDGIFDVVIGSPLVNNRQGGVAVFLGSREVINLTESEIPFAEIPARGLGVIFVGEEAGDLAGARVAGVNDIDGDGNDDILIAAPNRSVRLDIDLDGDIEIDRETCGVVYLIYGSPNLRGTISLAQIGTEQLPGAVFVGRNSGDFLGAGLGELGDRSVGIAGAGDVDGDGRNDLMMSSVTAAPRNRVRAGEVYLLYGEGD